MAIFKITRLGLSSITVLVVLLWGCVFTERALVRQARMDNYRALRQMRKLKLLRHVEPAAQPQPMPSRQSHPVLG